VFQRNNLKIGAAAGGGSARDGREAGDRAGVDLG
jgi:hypothetical protein